MDKMIGKSVTVCGRVQGVFYRASTRDKASSLGLRGWVKNLPSGDVQIEAFGEESVVQELIAWCKHGPPMASVTSIKVEETAFREEAPFRVVY